jgi:hypothetical protein
MPPQIEHDSSPASQRANSRDPDKISKQSNSPGPPRSLRSIRFQVALATHRAAVERWPAAASLPAGRTVDVCAFLALV